MMTTAVAACSIPMTAAWGYFSQTRFSEAAVEFHSFKTKVGVKKDSQVYAGDLAQHNMVVGKVACNYMIP